MTHLDIIHAWKDPEYRLSLGDAERVLLPAHPAGLIALTDAEMAAIAGGGTGGSKSTVKPQPPHTCSGGCGWWMDPEQWLGRYDSPARLVSAGRTS